MSRISELKRTKREKASPAVFSHSLRRFTVLPWGMNQNEKSTEGENINLKRGGRQNGKKLKKIGSHCFETLSAMW